MMDSDSIHAGRTVLNNYEINNQFVPYYRQSAFLYSFFLKKFFRVRFGESSSSKITDKIHTIATNGCLDLKIKNEQRLIIRSY
jgi:hypothetical protein